MDEPKSKRASIVLTLPFNAARLRCCDFAAARRSIPTILQLLVFAETVPTVSELVDCNPRRVRIALTVGSLCPLLLEIAWATLGLGLLRPGVDPVDVLLANSRTAAPVRVELSPSHSEGSTMLPTQAPTAVLAFSAVATTALGSVLALRSDATRSRRRAACLAALPAVAIAMSSPDVFFRAMDFAGAYPVALLWGVFPPIALLRLRRANPRAPRSAGPDAWLAALAAAASLFVLSTAARDLVGLVRR